MQTGTNDIAGGGAIGFTPNRFTQPPVVVCQIMWNYTDAWRAPPVKFYVTNVNKDSFSYNAQANRPGDRVSWIAIGNWTKLVKLLEV